MKTEKYTLVVDANMCLVGVVHYICTYYRTCCLLEKKDYILSIIS